MLAAAWACILGEAPVHPPAAPALLFSLLDPQTQELVVTAYTAVWEAVCLRITQLGRDSGLQELCHTTGDAGVTPHGLLEVWRHARRRFDAESFFDGTHEQIDLMCEMLVVGAMCCGGPETRFTLEQVKASHRLQIRLYWATLWSTGGAAATPEQAAATAVWETMVLRSYLRMRVAGP